MKTWNTIVFVLLAMIPIAFAQNPMDAVAGSAQEQMNTIGQQLQQKAAQHLVEGNLTQEHISQELNVTKQNLTKQAKGKLNQKLNESLNLTPEQLQQKATEELKKQINQKVPGFEALIALISLLCAVLVMGKRS